LVVAGTGANAACFCLFSWWEAPMTKHDMSDAFDGEQVAGNGLLDRRIFLRRGGLLLGAVGLAGVGRASQAETLNVPEWTKAPGAWFATYTQPSKYESKVVRGPMPNDPYGGVGPGSVRTPLQHLEGMITPSGLHFERSHNGVPDIDPAQHKLLIHGLVKRPQTFTMESLSRYPMTSRIAFIECAGNSGPLYAAKPVDGTAQSLHGLLSCSEWTGVPLALLLEEAGVDSQAKWIVAEGADAAAMSRSVPIAKAFDDAIVALYQNGERIRPSNGYPMRLLLPGYQGNMNVKWLRRLKLVREPAMAKDETSKYSLLLKEGKVAQFNFPLDAKSVITKPSPGINMSGPGLYEVSGVAWSGNGKIAKVDVSADGGKSWAPAALADPVLSKAITRFRIPWRWSGGPAVLQSRAVDETGYVQPTREAQIAARGNFAQYHCNLITSWGIGEGGEVKHVYA
jgi:sulfane dehydrogenase subunit SoxC